MKKIIFIVLGIVFLMGLLSAFAFVSPSKLDFTNNPWTFKTQYLRSSNFTGENLTADYFFGVVNSTDFWDNLNTPADITGLVDSQISDTLTISSLGSVVWSALNTYPTTCSSSQYISGLGDTLTCAAISITISQISDIANADVNRSDYWDDLNSPSDINTGDLTDDNTYVQIIGDTMTGNLSVEGNITADEFFGDIESDFVKIALGSGSPTVDQIQEYLDNTGSSGFFTGGEITDGGAGTIDVAAGSGFIRTTNDANAEIQSFRWSASSGIAVTDDTTQYIYVDDSGVISLSTDEFLETPDKIQIGVATDSSGSITHNFDLGVRLEESVGQMGRFIRRVLGISRDIRRGGLIFGQSGDVNRDVTMTAGTLWWGRTDYTMASFDTSGADVFSTYSASGLESSTASQFPNTQYDNAGTLTTMTNNRWANLFFYIDPDGHISMVYGRAEFTSQAGAEMEGVPVTSLPSEITETSILTARYTFQKSANTATISSAFDTLFSAAGITDHGDLAGLSDNDHPQYLLTSDWNATNTSYYLASNPLGFYNITDFDISNYFTSSQILGFNYYNSTTIPSYILTTSEGSLDVNSANLWDSLNSPSDITGLIDSQISDILTISSAGSVVWASLNTYPTACSSSQYISGFGDTLTCASVSITENQVSDLQGYLLSLVSDTTPQLGGYLDTNTNDIGSTSDEIENIYVGVDTRIYFGDGQETSIYYNGTALIMG